MVLWYCIDKQGGIAQQVRLWRVRHDRNVRTKIPIYQDYVAGPHCSLAAGLKIALALWHCGWCRRHDAASSQGLVMMGEVQGLR